ncbi:MAG TPA: hypothetical protein P5186_26340, partial [Candidatus Paceibacterota bacterium]|nr:hypothetical protein [Verrucomicrobiota bacterium]HRY51573.1 hypothetical protein [Candidatus Paceibacterota bacterium]HSA01134.1 hypothetical protein [Candidatus Paceibacterota bacterium]
TWYLCASFGHFVFARSLSDKGKPKMVSAIMTAPPAISEPVIVTIDNRLADLDRPSDKIRVCLHEPLTRFVSANDPRAEK